MNTSSNRKITGPLQDWLDSHPHSMPLRATTDSPKIEDKRLEHWIGESNLPSDSLVTAMIWLRIGVIDPAHEIVQKGTTSMASYLHGIVHRLEGDYSNSKYWFRQVRDSRLLEALSQSMEKELPIEGLTSIAESLGIFKVNGFDPSQLVAAVEQLNQHPHRNPDNVNAIERLCWLEWSSLWGIVC